MIDLKELAEPGSAEELLVRRLDLKQLPTGRGLPLYATPSRQPLSWSSRS
jgi:hypothetical protein